MAMLIQWKINTTFDIEVIQSVDITHTRIYTGQT